MTMLAASATTNTRPAPRPSHWFLAAILRSPLHRVLSITILVFEYVGRRSGQAYATPINYLQVGDTLLVSSDSAWGRNFPAGSRAGASVVLRGRRQSVTVELVEDADQAAQDLLSLVRAQPNYGRWANVGLDTDGVPSRADADAEIARGRRLLRLHLSNPESR